MNAPPGLEIPQSAHLITKAVRLPDGTVSRVSALDSHWATPPLNLPTYLPVDQSDPFEGLAWSAAAPSITRQLDDLLAMPFNVFWSYVLFDASVVPFIDSLLRFAPREFNVHVDGHASSAVLQLFDEALVSRCLLILMRIAEPSSQRKTTADFLAVEHWRTLVYDRWIFDAPKLLDMCALYGFSNRELSRRVVCNLLKLEPRYIDDLGESLGAVGEALSQTCGSVAANGSARNSKEVWSLPFASVLDTQSAEEVARLSEWLQDSAGTLHSLMHVAADTLADCLHGRLIGPNGLLTSIQMVVELALPLLVRRANGLASGATPQAAESGVVETKATESTRGALRNAAVHFLLTASSLINVCLIAPIETAASSQRHPQPELLEVIGQLADPCAKMVEVAELYARARVETEPATERCSAERQFSGAGALLQQLLLVCGLNEGVERLCNSALDRFHAEALRQLTTATPSSMPATGQHASAGGVQRINRQTAQQEKVAAVRELFPTCGEGFICAALNHLGSTTAVVEALLEDCLPPQLKSLPRDLETEPSPDPNPTTPVAPPPEHLRLPGDVRQQRKSSNQASDNRAGAAKQQVRRVNVTDKMADEQREWKQLTNLGARAVAGAYDVPFSEYDDEWDDSFELPGAKAIGAGVIDESFEPVIAKDTAASFSRAPTSGNEEPMPANALEWARAMGLGQYAEAMRAAGIIRLELAARLSEADISRFGVLPRHRERFLGATARLADRLRKRGRHVPIATTDTSGYAAASAIHYDNETGQFWGEDGSFDRSAGASVVPPEGPSQGSMGHLLGAETWQHQQHGLQHQQLSERPNARSAPTPARQKIERNRKEQSKATCANHNRKQRAYRKTT